MFDLKKCFLIILMLVLTSWVSSGLWAQPIQPVAVSTDTIGDYYPVINLINGVGLTGSEPQGHLFNTGDGLWVTRGTWPQGYFQVYGPVHLVFDLGKDMYIDGIYIWAYAASTGVANTFQANSLKDFELRFHTAAQGATNFTGNAEFEGTVAHPAILPTGSPVEGQTTPRQDFNFGKVVKARYIQMTITSNYFGAPNGRGGDRCGAAEMRFKPANLGQASQPTPENGATNIPVETTLSWLAGRVKDPSDPNFLIPNPDLVKHVIYMSNGDPNNPTLNHLADVSAGTPVQAQGQYGPLTLERNMTYYWRVDEVTDTNTITGQVWSFKTVLSVPIIEEGTPADVFVKSGQDATFTISATNPFFGNSSGLSYQWYKVDTGGDIAVGSNSPVYTLTGATLSDEGKYYCVVTITNPAINTSSTSDTAQLTIERRIAYWPMDGNADDVDGDADGTVVGSPNFNAQGIVGGTKAVQLNGTSDYIDIPRSKISWNPKGDFSVSLWAKVTGGQGQYRAVISDRHEPPSQGFILYAQNNNYWRFWTGKGAGWDSLSGPAVELNKWIHLVITCETTGISGDSTFSTKTIYVNGVQVAQSFNALYRPKDADTSDLFIGAGQNENPANFYFPGLIDDVRLYNYAIEPIKVAQLYTDVMGGTVCYNKPAYDFDNDCRVTLSDFALLVSQWLECNLVPASACP